MPDAAVIGTAISAIARVARTYSEHEFCFVWAQLILGVLSTSANLPTNIMTVLRDHSQACSSSENLKASLLECTVSRVYFGDGSNICSATYPDLKILQTLTRALILVGGHLRFGAPPLTWATRARNSSRASCVSTASQSAVNSLSGALPFLLFC